MFLKLIIFTKRLLIISIQYENTNNNETKHTNSIEIHQIMLFAGFIQKPILLLYYYHIYIYMNQERRRE